MSRRRRAEKREIAPDPVYGSTLLAKFINKVMESGKKSTARRIVYNALDKFAKRIKAENPLEAFEQALGKCETFSRSEIAPHRRRNLSSAH